MLHDRGMALTFWTVGILIAAVNCGDNTIYSSQYKRYVNLTSLQPTARTQPVRNWLQCGSLCSRMGLDCLGYNLKPNKPSVTHPYTCEIKGLPLNEGLKIPYNDYVYYDLQREGPHWLVHNDACLPGHDDVTLKNVTLNACWSRCLAEGPSACNSVDYDHKSRNCIMSPSSAGQTGETLANPCGVPGHWFTYIERSLVVGSAGDSST